MSTEKWMRDKNLWSVSNKVVASKKQTHLHVAHQFSKLWKGLNIILKDSTSSGPAVKKYMRLIAANPVFIIFERALDSKKTNELYL